MALTITRTAAMSLERYVRCRHSWYWKVVLTDGKGTVLPAEFSLLLDSDTLTGGYSVATTHKDGSFEFGSVPSGRHQLSLRGGVSGTHYIKWLRYGSVESTVPEFSVTAGEGTMEVLLSARGARVSGVVRLNGATGTATPQVVLLPETANAGLQHHDTHLGTLDQSGGFAVKEPVRPGAYTVYAFEGLPEGVWTDAEFMMEMEGKGVRIKVGESEAKTVEVPLIARSGIAGLLTRLGID